jgi:O-antigen/teichoic acid export membrane protein
VFRKIWLTVSRLVFYPAKRWASSFAQFTAVQTVAQLMGALTGVIVVRLLTKDDYALYTIANSMLSALVLLVDGGIGAAAAGIGGRVWQDSHLLGRTIRTALSVRKLLWTILGAPVAIILAWLLLTNGASVARTAMIIPITLAGAALSLGAGIYIVVPRLTGNVKFLQAVTLTTASVRLATIAAFSLIGLSTETALLTVTGGYAAAYWQTRRWSRRRINANAPIDPLVKSEFHSVLRRQLPSAVYYIFQLQISIWLLSIFGSTDRIADLGALNRIGVIFTVLSAVMDAMVLPRYSRCNDPSRLWVLYIQIVAGFAILTLIPTIFIVLLPRPVLWVLGPQYAQLTPELVLVTLSCMISALTGVVWSLNTTRAWFLPAWIYISCGILLQTILLLTVGASTIQQVVVMAMIMNFAQILMSVSATAVFITRFRRKARVEPIESA